jgi:hypothetical protein
MSAPHESRAELAAFGAPPSRATAILATQNLGQRLARALAGLVGCWAAAIVSVFIPVAHFFLVPGFLVLGVVWAVARSRERQRLLGLRGTCPRCGRDEEFGRGERQGGQTWVTCPGCFTRLLVTIEPAAPHGPDVGGQPLTSARTVR